MKITKLHDANDKNISAEEKKKAIMNIRVMKIY